jgi:alpha-1,2-mannosyltransferase
MQDSFSLAPDGVSGDGRSLPLGVVHALWIAFAAAICVRSVVQPGQHTIYPILVAGTNRWWHDLPLHTFLSDLQDLYRYSPTFAILFTPLAKLPAWLGAGLWGLLNIGLLYAALRAMVRDLLPGDWPKRRKAAFFGLTLWGAAAGIWSAQSNAMVIALAVFACAAIVRQRWWRSAVLLGLAVFIKLWPIALVLLLVTFWPKRLGWRFAVVFVFLAILPFFTRPATAVVEQYREWYVSLTEFQEIRRWPGFRDAWTLWENLWPPVSAAGYHAVQLVAAALVWAWCIAQRRRLKSRVSRVECREAKESREPKIASRLSTLDSPLSTIDSRCLTGCFLTLVLSIWVAWQLLFGPGSEQLTYGILAPSAAWAVTAGFAEKRHRVWTLTTCLLAGLLGSGDAEKFFQTVFHRLNLPISAAVLLPLCVVSFLGWLLWTEKGIRTIKPSLSLWERGRGPSGSSQQ